MRKTQIVLGRMLTVADKVIVEGRPRDVRSIVKAPGRTPTDGQRKLHVYYDSDKRLSVKPNEAVRIFPRA